MRQSALSAFVMALALSSATLAETPDAVQTPEEQGLAIARSADARGAGYGDYTALGQMILRDRGGGESKREFQVSTLEVLADGDKSIIVFGWPADIKDTGLLTIGHKVQEDEQWLYLPALKRVKRISSSNRSGSFVGSEFTFEDMVGEEIERYHYRWLGDEPCPGAEDLICHINERSPKETDSGYSRHVVWLDASELRAFRVDYYDRRRSLLKTMTIEGYQLYNDRFWRPGKMVMTNHQNGKSTIMLWQDYKFNVGLRSEDFSTRALERGR